MTGRRPESTDAEYPCNHEGCPNTHPSHKWGAIRAHDQGWFLQRNGDHWCPDHVPDWVRGWRPRGEPFAY